MTSLTNKDCLEIDEETLSIVTVDRYNQEFVCKKKDGETIIVPIASARVQKGNYSLPFCNFVILKIEM